MPYRNKPNSVKKPWGGYEILEKNLKFWIKKLYVKKGARLSLQTHKHRQETWVVLAGKILARKGSTEKILSVGEVITIEKNEMHRITGVETAIVLEAAVGKPLETDIVRHEDDFNRHKK